jgi:hypothetical protein
MWRHGGILVPTFLKVGTTINSLRLFFLEWKLTCVARCAFQTRSFGTVSPWIHSDFRWQPGWNQCSCTLRIGWRNQSIDPNSKETCDERQAVKSWFSLSRSHANLKAVFGGQQVWGSEFLKARYAQDWWRRFGSYSAPHLSLVLVIRCAAFKTPPVIGIFEDVEAGLQGEREITYEQYFRHKFLIK